MGEKNDFPGMIRRYRRLAKRIVLHHFGRREQNCLQAVRTDQLRLCRSIMLKDSLLFGSALSPRRINAFRKELWASQKVREAGVPSPEVIAVGNELLTSRT